MFDDEHHAEFRRAGLVRLPGAIAAKDTQAMVDRIWEHLDRRHGVARGRPETWTVEKPSGLRDITAAAEFEALGSAVVRAAVDDLLGIGRWDPPRRWGRLMATNIVARADGAIL